VLLLLEYLSSDFFATSTETGVNLLIIIRSLFIGIPAVSYCCIAEVREATTLYEVIPSICVVLKGMVVQTIIDLTVVYITSCV